MADTRTPAPNLVDAVQAVELLRVSESWTGRATRERCIPSRSIGTSPRQDAAALATPADEWRVSAAGTDGGSR